MMVFQSVRHFTNFQRFYVKKTTLRNYESVLTNFKRHFGDEELSSISPEEGG